MSHRPILIDLFCGCGGFSLGAARAGFSVVGAADNNPLAIESHKKNFPKTKHIDKDLGHVSGAEIRELLGLGDRDIDGVIGGPPCQGFSSMGRRDESDSRNQLFIAYFRLVAELRPRFFLSENVPGILRAGYDDIRKEAFRQVEKEYVLLDPMEFTASDYGAPTSRHRVFFFGYRKDQPFEIDEESFLPPPDVERVHVEDALQGLPVAISDDWQEESQGWRSVGESHNGAFGRRLNGDVPEGMGDPEAVRQLTEERQVSGCLGTRHTPAVLKRFRKIVPGGRDATSKFPRLDPKGFCPTLRAGTGSEKGSYQAVRPIHPTENRVITPREAARLQGFPDWFQFHATKWHSFRQIGNSVSPILAEHVLYSILEAINANKTTRRKGL